MGIKLMHKPYHIVAKDSTGVESFRLTAHPPTRPGLNEDGKNPKTKDGQWVRVFTVTDSGNSSYAVGDKITMTQVRGEFPVAEVDNLQLTVESIEGIRAKKVHTKKKKEQVVPDVKTVDQSDEVNEPTSDSEVEIKPGQTSVQVHVSDLV